MAENSETINQEPNWSSMIMHTEGKGGRYHAMFTKEGQEFASQKWGEFLGTMPEASFNEIKKAVQEYKEDTKDKYDGSKKEYRNLLVRSFEARVNHLEIAMLGEQVNSLLSQWGGELGQVIDKKYSDKRGFGKAKTLKEKRDYLLTLKERIATPVPNANKRNLSGIRRQDIIVSPDKKLTRYGRVKAAVAGIAAGVAIWTVLHGSFDKGRKPVEDKSTPTGIPTVVAELSSPTIEAALQTETPTELIVPTNTATQTATQTETIEPTYTSTPNPTNTDLPTQTATERPINEPAGTSTNEPTITPSSVPPTETPPPTNTPEPTNTDEPTPTEIPPTPFSEHVPVQPASQYIINHTDNPNYGTALQAELSIHRLDDPNTRHLIPQNIRDALSFGPTRTLAENVVRLYNSDADVDKEIKAFALITSSDLDDYMQDNRGGSTATTPGELYGPNDLRFRGGAFESSAYRNNQISHSLAVEEFVQSRQYQNFYETVRNNPDQALEFGFKSPEDVMQAVTDGNLRATLELIQQMYKYENGVYENSYFFINQAGQISNEGGASTNKDTVQLAFNNFVNFVESFTGKSYTVEELMDAENLFEINQAFRERHHNGNIWDTVGIKRGDSLNIEPRIIFDKVEDQYVIYTDTEQEVLIAANY